VERNALGYVKEAFWCLIAAKTPCFGFHNMMYFSCFLHLRLRTLFLFTRLRLDMMRLYSLKYTTERNKVFLVSKVKVDRNNAHLPVFAATAQFCILLPDLLQSRECHTRRRPVRFCSASPPTVTLVTLVTSLCAQWKLLLLYFHRAPTTPAAPVATGPPGIYAQQQPQQPYAGQQYAGYQQQPMAPTEYERQQAWARYYEQQR
jgi:hypothetical protein